MFVVKHYLSFYTTINPLKIFESHFWLPKMTQIIPQLPELFSRIFLRDKVSLRIWSLSNLQPWQTMQIHCDLDVQICKFEFYKERRGRQAEFCLPTKFARHVNEYLAGLTKGSQSWHIGQVGNAKQTGILPQHQKREKRKGNCTCSEINRNGEMAPRAK